jgi:hypothetical protein
MTAIVVMMIVYSWDATDAQTVEAHASREAKEIYVRRNPTTVIQTAENIHSLVVSSNKYRKNWSHTLTSVTWSHFNVFYRKNWSLNELFQQQKNIQLYYNVFQRFNNKNFHKFS